MEKLQRISRGVINDGYLKYSLLSGLKGRRKRLRKPIPGIDNGCQ